MNGDIIDFAAFKAKKEKEQEKDLTKIMDATTVEVEEEGVDVRQVTGELVPEPDPDAEWTDENGDPVEYISLEVHPEMGDLMNAVQQMLEAPTEGSFQEALIEANQALVKMFRRHPSLT